MRSLLAAIALLVALAVPVAANEKVTICHVPAGNPENAHTITISENALKAHLGENEEGLHGGDYRGECEVSATPDPAAPVKTDQPVPSAAPSVEPVVPQPVTETPLVLPDTAVGA